MDKNLLKSILYKAKYRGTKENDLLIYKFTQFVLNKFSDNHLILDQLNKFIHLDDQAINDLCKTNKIDNNHTNMITLFKEFLQQYNN